MKRINKKGFTMVELLATITILSILTVVILFSVKNVIENSHKSYYDGEEKMITLSGQTYFSDYKSKLPKEMGGIEKVTLKTLIDEKYIDPVYNHNKEACFYDQSFTYAQKIDDENYQYYTYLSCPGGYNTEIDKTKPVIKFNPNKGLSNKNIEVKMEITDNKNIKSYQYIVLKNDVEVKNSNVVPYKENPTITLTEDGIYQIIGYAWDDATNMGTKTSGKYEIKKTGPNCSNIVFNIDKTPEVWTTGQVNLTIQVPEDTQRWTWATRNALNLTSSTAYGKAKQYLGTSSQTVSFTKDGQNQGKIVLYDKVGNHCSIETARYFLWNSPPTFSDFTITSTVKEYNAVTTKLTIPASNPPGLPMQMYISNSGFETGESWENYAPSKDWNVGGTMDGGTRTVYITIRDSLGNKKNIKKTYKVYHECQNLKADAAIYGGCSEPCRETWVTGTQSVTIHNRDRLTNKICRTDNSTQQCNTQMCCSSVNYSGWSGCSAACASNGVVPTKTRTATSAYKPSRTCTTSDNSSIQLVTSSGCQTSDCCSSLREVLGSWSGCDKECGGGKKYQSAEYYSNYDGRWCKSESKARSQNCNTQSCSFAVKTESVTGGSISVVSTATPGSTVSFTATPTDSGKDNDFTYQGARIYSNGNLYKTLSASQKSFTMPSANVSIRPKWKKNDRIILELDSSQDPNISAGQCNAGQYASTPEQSGIPYPSCGNDSDSYCCGYVRILRQWNRHFIRFESVTTINGRKQTNILSDFKADHYQTIQAIFNEWDHAQNNIRATVWLGFGTFQGGIYPRWVHDASYVTSRNGGAQKERLTMNLDITNATGFGNLGFEVLTNNQVTFVDLIFVKLYGRLYE